MEREDIDPQSQRIRKARVNAGRRLSSLVTKRVPPIGRARHTRQPKEGLDVKDHSTPPEGGRLSVGRTIQFPAQELGNQGDGEALAKTPDIPRQENQGIQSVHALSREASYRRHIVRQQEAQRLEEGCKTFLKGQLIVINSSQKGENPEETRLDP